MIRMNYSASRLDTLRAHARKGVLLIAHRGARGLAPENTIEAFKKAAALGSDMVEFDVHLSRDGSPVVVHDDDLLRCTDVTQRFPRRSSYFVSDFSLAELTTLDAGTWYVDQLKLPAAERMSFLQDLTAQEQARYLSDDELGRFASGNVCIPSLRQLLEYLESTELLMNVEIKTIPRMYPGIAERVLEQINHFGLSTRTVISSFDHEQLRNVRALDSHIATAVLSSDRLCGLGKYLDALDADAFHPGCYGDYDSLGFGSVDGRLQLGGVEEVLNTGRWVNVWTCNSENQMAALIESGVSGIMTDYPNRFPRSHQDLANSG